MGVREAIHNVFMMTSSAIKRFGLWDENIYPAFCEGEPTRPRVPRGRPLGISVQAAAPADQIESKNGPLCLASSCSTEAMCRTTVFSDAVSTRCCRH